ncbi:MAG: bifunctional 4-hydroxy-3-methylbut-2-enyl diphosphate reductase/30S ribosomal protein S1 [Clostridia bacterium]|nr:bifunctional 4-hydroxy-3-methylbut-2-enyl diphosphate reductase/30S ribosomal protein S1 [Clostridia bacterium]
MRVLLAEYAGFCFGVKRAIATADLAAEEHGHIYSLGPLIHNPQEIERLKTKITPINSLDDVNEGVVIIRTHGVGPETFTKAKEKGLMVIDATCPFVKKVQMEAKALAEAGYQVVIVGDKKHPEVEAILSWTNNTARVVTSPEEVALLPQADKIGVVAQTTQEQRVLDEVVKLLQKRFTHVKTVNTICHATSDRQKAVLDLASRVDGMIVIGGTNSANTQKLAKICRNLGVPTQLVEAADDLDLAKFYSADTIGISAGASTPDWIIEEVVRTMTEMEKVLGQEENQEVVEMQAEAVEAVKAEEKAAEEIPAQAEAKVEEAASEAVEEEEESFAEAYNHEMKDLHRGARVSGIVVQIRDNEILVDIGGKSEGVVPSAELMPEEAENIRGSFNIGDEIEVIILKKENKEGYPVLSKKRVDQELVWEKIKAQKEAGEIIEGKVVDVVRGGALVDVGVRGFVPASLIDVVFVEDLSTYVGKVLPMKILECDRSKNKLVLSPKAVMLEEAKKRKAELWEELAEGQTRKGIVRRLTNFGAFVDLGGIDGLLHVSEMAWYRVNHPSDLLKEGDELEVYVLNVDKESEKISLGLKQLVPNPWTIASEKYPVGIVIKAKVMRTAPFGAFLQVEPGVEGLVHISHLSRQRVEKTEDVVKPGDEVEVKVLSVDAENKRMSLSIKETLPELPKAEPAFAASEASAKTKKAEEAKEEHEEELKVTLGDLFADVIDNVKEGSVDVKGKAKILAEELKEKAADLKEYVKSEEIKEDVEDAVDEVKEFVNDTVKAVKKAVKELKDDQQDAEKELEKAAKKVEAEKNKAE